MELIQKRIMRIMTTGTTTGCTPCAVIIPNLNINYYFKISLTAESPDIGFFDVNAQYPYGYAYITSTIVENYNIITGIGENLLLDINYI